jgi:hypothetical protein
MGSVRPEEVARASGQNASHPNTHTKTRAVPPGLRTRAVITPCVTATSRGTFFGFEEEGGVPVLLVILVRFDLSARQ